MNLSEVTWFKSSHSSADQDCVEVAFLPHGLVGVRDSKNPSGPALIVGPGAWDAFTTEVSSEAFDR